MLRIIRTNSENTDFQSLIRELDKELAKKNGETNHFFAQYNKIDLIKNVIVVYNDSLPIACGAFKAFDNASMEVKRMYVKKEFRGKGFAVAILIELETWIKELSCKRCILETGEKMQEAIGLYKKCGYKIIRNYGPYENVESSICFEKILV